MAEKRRFMKFFTICGFVQAGAFWAKFAKFAIFCFLVLEDLFFL